MSQMPAPIINGHVPGPGDYWAVAEPSPRRVRVMFSGKTVADSRHAMLFRESQKLPVYYFPKDDVRTDLLLPIVDQLIDPQKGSARQWDLTVEHNVARAAAWCYTDGIREWPDMRDYFAFDWPKMDAWYEEDEEVFVHPRDPYKRVDVIASSRRIKILLGGVPVAESSHAHLLFETGLPTRYYLPAEDVHMDLLRPSDTHTRCPYKGIASYWSAMVGDKTYPDIVWSYPSPIAECPKIKDLLCFFNERVDPIFVDDEVQPRPRTKWSTD